MTIKELKEIRLNETIGAFNAKIKRTVASESDLIKMQSKLKGDSSVNSFNVGVKDGKWVFVDLHFTEWHGGNKHHRHVSQGKTNIRFDKLITYSK